MPYALQLNGALRFTLGKLARDDDQGTVAGIKNVFVICLTGIVFTNIFLAKLT